MLDLKVKDQGGAGGTEYVVLLLRNSASSRCVLSGYPAVVFVDSDRHRIDASVEHRDDKPAPRVTLKKGGVANALLTSGAVGCSNPPKATTIRVTPPDDGDPLIADLDLLVCNPAVTAIHPGEKPPSLS